MGKKKSSKTKKTNQAIKSSVDITDLDAIMEDMKRLAIEPPQEITIEEKVEEVETVDDINNFEESQIVETEEKVEEEQTQPTVEETVEIITEEKEPVEDVSFVDTIKAENDDVEPVDVPPAPKKTKPKKQKKYTQTYEQMFGSTWMGYGYTES